MKERYLWKVKVTLGMWIDTTLKVEFHMSSKERHESDAKKEAEEIIFEKFGDDWEIKSYDEFRYIDEVFSLKKVKSK